MKKDIRVLLASVTMGMALIMCGCGSSGYSSSHSSYNSSAGSYAMKTAAEAPAAEMAYEERAYDYTEDGDYESGNGSVDVGPEAVDTRKLIRTVSFQIQIQDGDDLQGTVDNITGLVKERKGYIAYNHVSQDDYTKYANLTCKVPKDKVDDFLNSVREHEYKITDISDNIDDVTMHYTDVESRLRVQETARDKYMEYLKDADNIADILEIEKRLDEVIADIESYQAQIKSLDNKIDYTEISIYIDCRRYTEAPGFVERLADELSDVEYTIIGAIGWLISALIYCIVAAPVIFIILRVVRFSWGSIKLFGNRKKKDKKAKADSAPAPETDNNIQQ